jgi:hypothetical protein
VCANNNDPHPRGLFVVRAEQFFGTLHRQYANMEEG